MIKLGQLAEQAISKQFPDNWKSLAIMMNIPFTMYNDGEDDLPEDMFIEIEFNDTKTLVVKANNSISTSATLTNETIAQMLVEIAQQP